MATTETTEVTPAKRQAYLDRAQRARIRAYALGVELCPECQGAGRKLDGYGSGDCRADYEQCPICAGSGKRGRE